MFGKNQFKDFKNIGPPGPVEISENPNPGPKWFSIARAKGAGPSLEGDFAQADKASMDYTKECFIGDPGKEGSYSLREVQLRSNGPYPAYG